MNYVKIILVVVILFVLIFSSWVIYNMFIFPHYPLGDSCQIDDDCVCRSMANDGCGEYGDVWKCVDNKCDIVSIVNERRQQSSE